MNTELQSKESKVCDSLLLLTTEGRYSHSAESNLMVFRKVGHDFIVAATNEREHVKPDWYLNLKEEPIVRLEVDGAAFYAKASTPVGKARLKLLPVMAEISDITREIIPRDTAVVVFSPML